MQRSEVTADAKAQRQDRTWHVWKSRRKPTSWSFVREGLCALTEELPNLRGFGSKMSISRLSVFLIRRWLSSEWPFRDHSAPFLPWFHCSYSVAPGWLCQACGRERTCEVLMGWEWNTLPPLPGPEPSPPATLNCKGD